MEGGLDMGAFLKDLRFGARALIKKPGSAIVSVVVLSLSFGRHAAPLAVTKSSESTALITSATRSASISVNGIGGLILMTL